MPIKIPDLDPRTFDELTAELVSEIPKFSRVWDDYNYSDPGITIMEMLTWIIETLSYRTNRIPADTYRTFLYLLGGASYDEINRLLRRDWKLDPDYKAFLEELASIAEQPEPDPVEMRRKAVTYYKKPYLAVTREDFEIQALEANRIIPPDALHVGRAEVKQQGEVAVVLITPDRSNRNSRDARNSYFSLGMPDTEGTQLRFLRSRKAAIFYKGQIQQIKELLDRVRLWLEPRTLLGTAVKVQLAPDTFVELGIQALLDTNANLALRSREIEAEILAWLDPIQGGPDGTGWPLDQPPHAADLISLLLTLPYVKRVMNVKLHFFDGPGEDANVLPEKAFRGFAVPKITLNLRKMQPRIRGGRR